MKQVISNPTVLCENVTNKKFYGVQIYTDRGFITSCGRQISLDKPYFVMAINGMTHGNSYGWKDKSLTHLIDKIINSKGHYCGVFEFDTNVELFKWLSE